MTDIDARQIAMTTSLEVTADERAASREAARNEPPPVRVPPRVMTSLEVPQEAPTMRRGPGRPRNPAHSATKHVHNPDSPISPFGGVPPEATHWRIFRQVNQAWEQLHWGPPGEMQVREWPLAELTAANLKARWGHGTFRPQFLRPTDRGGMRSLNHGKEVRLTEDVAASAPVTVQAPPAAPSLDSLTSALRVLDVIEGQADRKIAGMALLAQQFVANRSEGITASDLREILRTQAETTAAAIAAAIAPIQAQLEELGEEEDDDEGTIGLIAGAAAPMLKGKGTWVQLLNFAAANPSLAEAVITKGLPLVAGLAEVVTSALRASPTPPPAAPPPQRPQALIPADVLARRRAAAVPVPMPVPESAHTNTVPPPNVTPTQRAAVVTVDEASARLRADVGEKFSG